MPEWIAMDAGSCDALCTLTADACYASCPGSGLPGRIQCMRDCLGAYDACMETCLGH
ncbi:MAG: hypothetical protein K8H90_04455 [Thermoanaerobaculia bacterium]|nr:hypothetical protein [Thermoanaerobaculia bacterium]